MSDIEFNYIVDQPVGTGLSYTTQPYLGTMKEVCAQG